MAFELTDDTGHGIGHEYRPPGWVVAVDGGDQPSPGGLDEVLGRRPTAVAVAAGQPIGQAQVGRDDPLPQHWVAAGGVLAEPCLDRGRRLLVARVDLQDGMVRKLGDGGRHRGTSLGLVVHEGWVDGAAQESCELLLPWSDPSQTLAGRPGGVAGMVDTRLWQRRSLMMRWSSSG